MRGRRLVGGIWKVKKEVIWHSDRFGRFPFFFRFDGLSSTTVPTITRPVQQVGGGFFLFFFLSLNMYMKIFKL